jgi:hypothetical protein
MTPVQARPHVVSGDAVAHQDGKHFLSIEQADNIRVGHRIYRYDLGTRGALFARNFLRPTPVEDFRFLYRLRLDI